MRKFPGRGWPQKMPVSLMFGHRITVLSNLQLLVFSDEDIGAKCEEQCEFQYIDCTLSCSDTNCLIECGRALTDCVQGFNFDVFLSLKRLFSRLSL